MMLCYWPGKRGYEPCRFIAILLFSFVGYRCLPAQTGTTSHDPIRKYTQKARCMTKALYTYPIGTIFVCIPYGHHTGHHTCSFRAGRFGEGQARNGGASPEGCRRWISRESPTEQGRASEQPGWAIEKSQHLDDGKTPKPRCFIENCVLSVLT